MRDRFWKKFKAGREVGAALSIRVDGDVAAYWPAFAQYSKERITLRHTLGHRAGLPAIRTALLATHGDVGRLACHQAFRKSIIEHFYGQP